MMENLLSIKQVAEQLGQHYQTVYTNKQHYGFFRLTPKGAWRVLPSVLEKKLEELQNATRLEARVGDKENLLCRSEKTIKVSGKLTSRRTGSEFDALVARLTKN